MSFRFYSLEVYIGYEAVAAFAAALLLDREGRLILCFSAAVAHELGHLAFMLILGVRVKGISLRLFDAVIDAESPKSFSGEIWITIGGPLVNLLLSAVFLPFGAFFGCANLAMGVFNLLPVVSLDGGRLLDLFLSKRFDDSVRYKILLFTSFVFILPVMAAGIIMLFKSGYNYSLLVISLYLLAVLFLKK